MNIILTIYCDDVTDTCSLTTITYQRTWYMSTMTSTSVLILKLSSILTSPRILNGSYSSSHSGRLPAFTHGRCHFVLHDGLTFIGLVLVGISSRSYFVCSCSFIHAPCKLRNKSTHVCNLMKFDPDYNIPICVASCKLIKFCDCQSITLQLWSYCTKHGILHYVKYTNKCLIRILETAQLS